MTPTPWWNEGEIRKTLEHCARRSGVVTSMDEHEGVVWITTESGDVYAAKRLDDGLDNTSFELSLREYC